MQLLTPSLGLIFWTALIFITVFFILRKYAWGPILKGLDDREETIDNALKTAERTKQEMAAMKSEHEVLLQQAKQERLAIIGEANRIKEQIVAEARVKAGIEVTRIMEEASREIENRKMEALIDVKNQIGTMVVDISEKVLRRELSSNSEQEAYIRRLADDLRPNSN